VSDLAIGGAERMLARLVTASDRARFRHSVVSLIDGGALAPQLVRAGLEVHGLGMQRGVPTPGTLARAAVLLRRLRPDIVQTWLYHADLLGLMAGRLAGCRTVMWNLRCSDMDLKRYRWSTGFVLRMLAKLSAVPVIVIANSEAGRRWHLSLGYRPQRFELIPNGIDTESFRPDPIARGAWRKHLNVPEGGTLVGMVARRDPMKNHEGFLRSAATVARRFRGAHFVLAGAGITESDAGLSSLAQAVQAPVRSLGECDDVPGLFAAMDVAVLASHFGEGFPNVVAEAMACETVCVATDVGDCAAIVGGTGVIVPRTDMAAMAGAVLTLASDPSLRARLGAQARQRIVAEFSLGRAVHRYEALWADAADRARR
jgi:glycosyltransferase involved in cell wall biosynthesis